MSRKHYSLKSQIFVALIASTSALAAATSQTEPYAPPITKDDCQSIRKLISEQPTPSEGGRIVIKVDAGIYNCKAPIVIARDNIVFEGAGIDRTVFRLADNVHAPLLVIGDPRSVIRADGQPATPKITRQVTVKNMSFDGNKANHDVTKECGEGICEGDATTIRNNSITIRGAEDIKVENVKSFDSISGGLVTEKFCKRLEVRNFESFGNHFDGFAGYQTEESIFFDMYLHNNRGAALSLDIAFNHNQFVGGRFVDNKDVGIFARDLEGNLFKNLSIQNSGNHGVFFASSAEKPEDRDLKCAKNNIFENVNISNSNGAGIRVNDLCSGNAVKGRSTFQNNSGGPISADQPDLVSVESSVRFN